MYSISECELHLGFRYAYLPFLDEWYNPPEEGGFMFPSWHYGTASNEV